MHTMSFIKWNTVHLKESHCVHSVEDKIIRGVVQWFILELV